MCLKYLTQFFLLACFVTVFLIYQSESRSFQFVHHKQVQRKCPQNSYYDVRHERCRVLPKGGEVVIIDYNKKCTNNYRGAKPHPTKKDYFYVCKNDSVVLGKCPEPQVYNAKEKSCEGGEPVPCVVGKDGTTCSTPGRFPVPSNCSQFYICDRDGRQYYRKVLQCPGSKKYNPLTQRCSYNYRCTPTMVYSTDSSIEDDSNDFPACKTPGRFRCPTNCALYFVCGLKKDGKFYQRRYRCPDGKLFDTTEKICLEESAVKCEYTTASQLMQLNDTIRERYTEESSEYTDGEYEDHLLDSYDSTNDTKLHQDPHPQRRTGAIASSSSNSSSLIKDLNDPTAPADFLINSDEHVVPSDKTSKSEATEVGDIGQKQGYTRGVDVGEASLSSVEQEQTDSKNMDSTSENQQSLTPKSPSIGDVQKARDDVDEKESLIEKLTQLDKEMKERTPESENDAAAKLEALIREEEHEEDLEKGKPAGKDQSAPKTSVEVNIVNNTFVQKDISEAGEGSAIGSLKSSSQNAVQINNQNIGGATLNQDISSSNVKSQDSQVAISGSYSKSPTTATSNVSFTDEPEHYMPATTDGSIRDPVHGPSKTETSTYRSAGEILSSGGQAGSSASHSHGPSQEILSATANANATVIQNQEVDKNISSSISEDTASAKGGAKLIQKGATAAYTVSPTFEDSDLTTTVLYKGIPTGNTVSSTPESSASATATADGKVFQTGVLAGNTVLSTSKASASSSTTLDLTANQEGSSTGDTASFKSEGNASATATADGKVFQTGVLVGNTVLSKSKASASSSTTQDLTANQEGSSAGDTASFKSEGSASATAETSKTATQKGVPGSDVVSPGSDDSAEARVGSTDVSYGGQISPTSEDSATPSQAITSTSQVEHSTRATISTAETISGREIKDGDSTGAESEVVHGKTSTGKAPARATEKPIAGTQRTSASQSTYSSTAHSSAASKVIGSGESATYSIAQADASTSKATHRSSENESQDFLPSMEDEGRTHKASYSRGDQRVGAVSATSDAKDVSDFISEEYGSNESRGTNFQSQRTSLSNVQTSVQDPSQNETLDDKLQVFYKLANESSVMADGSTPKDEVFINVFKPLRLVINFDPQGHAVQHVVGYEGGFS